MNKKFLFIMVLGVVIIGLFNVVAATGQRIYTQEDINQLTAQQQRALLAGIRSNDTYVINPPVTVFAAAQHYIYVPFSYDEYEEQE